MRIIPYTRNKEEEWNTFLVNSKNGLFLFERDYIEYHSDRFIDHSLMFYNGSELVALLPANISKNMLISHEGLTFGGLIINAEIKIASVFKIFDALIKYLDKQSIEKLVYKSIPYIYCSVPCEEDKYVLFRKGARLFRRDVASAIYLPHRLKFNKLRLRLVKKAMVANLEVREINDFKTFWSILETNLLERHNVRPTHSIDEIEYLWHKFPENIRVFASYKNEDMLAGAVIYEYTYVVRTQYIAGRKEIKGVGAIDFLFSYLIDKYGKDKEYFDFGISTENNGTYLNEGLISFKEGFGARAVTYDFYELSI